MLKRLFGRPIRKVRFAALGFCVPALLWFDSLGGIGLGEALVKSVGLAIAAFLLVCLIVGLAYFSRSAPADIASIPR